MATHGFVEELERHIAWQRVQLKATDSAFHRFLVYRPGDRWTVCAHGPMRKRALHNPRLPGCQSAKDAFQKVKVGTAEYSGHWDDTVSGIIPNFTRTSYTQGLGNIMSGLVSATAVAILSRRILLVENWTTASHSFGWPLTDLLLGRSGFESSLLRAQGAGSRLDSFMANDDISAADELCSVNLLHHPRARAWRMFSNQYFLNLLFLNPNHRKQLAAMGMPREGVLSPNVSPIWGPVLRFLLRPHDRLMQQINHFEKNQLRPKGHERVVGMHLRCVLLDGRCPTRLLVRAAECARERLAALNATHFFIAAMHQSHRSFVAQHLAHSTAQNTSILWYGDAVEYQDQNSMQEDARIADLVLLARADEVLISMTSTFGHMARGLATGKPAFWFQSCQMLPGEATEPALHVTKDVFRAARHCRVGNVSVTKHESNIAALVNTGMIEHHIG